jgi:hypothetical protein
VRRLIRIASIAFISVCLSGSAAAAVEPWADERLPVHDGLVLWLDASRQDRAFAAHAQPGTASVGPLAIWFDASGRGAHLVQRTQDAWPRLLAAVGRGAVHFDGKDDYLERTSLGPGLELGEFTVFTYAAPASNVGRFPALLAVNEVAPPRLSIGFHPRPRAARHRAL